MAQTLCLFEDRLVDRFLPLVYVRPVYDLRCGILTLREKILTLYAPPEVSLHCRPYVGELLRHDYPEVPVNRILSSTCLFLNGRVIANDALLKQIPASGKVDLLFTSNDQVVAARVSGTNLEKLKSKLDRPLTVSDFDGLPRREVDVEMVAYPWDIISQNGVELQRDFTRLARKKKSRNSHAKVHRAAHMLNKRDIFIGQGSSIGPGVVLDAENGPLYLGRNVQVLPQTTIVGPAYIGDGSLVKIGAQIYGNTSIGPVCKVGGEVEHSIIHGYSNKQHVGYLGHSYIGAWVNMGSGTTNSDLKNNYGTVKVQYRDAFIDTGHQFVGLLMGDHSKTAINSVFNAGTSVGVACNIFGHGFPPKYIPSFSWVGERLTTHDVERAIVAARRMMGRRSVQLSAEEEKLFRTIFELTNEERLYNRR